MGSAVLVIGAGGLGCPALLHLAASGIPTIGIADYDNVELSNLPRQLFYSEADVGRAKVDVAREVLSRMPGALSAEIRIHSEIVRGDEDFIGDYDIVIDAADRADVKLALHDEIVRRGITFVHAGASGWQAQGLTVRGAGMSRTGSSGSFMGGCLRCLFGHTADFQAPDCQSQGVLGPLVGLAGLLAADEALRIFAGKKGRWEKTFWSFDARSGRARRVSVAPDPNCAICSEPDQPVAIARNDA